MALQPFHEKTAVTGLGWTEFSRGSGTTGAVLVARASLMAIEDAGLKVEDIDGMVGLFYRDANATIAPRALAHMIGLPGLKLDYFNDGGGGWCAAAVTSAATMIHSGICKNVLVYVGRNRYSEGRAHRAADAYEARGPSQFGAPYGSNHAAVGFGSIAVANMPRYGLTSLDFAHLAVSQRNNAMVNKKAMMRKPITIEDHQNSRLIIWPYRLLDCCQETDGAVALVVSSAEQARDLKHNPVYVMSGAAGGPDEVPATAATLFEGAGVTQKDVDIVESYDDFTFQCLKQVTDFGFAPMGQAGDWVREGHITIDGDVPVNTHGGLLSEAHIIGLNHVIEAVQQLRTEGVVDDLCEGPHTYDRAKCRQVRDPNIAFVCGVQGGSAVLLRKG